MNSWCEIGDRVEVCKNNQVVTVKNVEHVLSTIIVTVKYENEDTEDLAINQIMPLEDVNA